VVEPAITSTIALSRRVRIPSWTAWVWMASSCRPSRIILRTAGETVRIS